MFEKRWAAVPPQLFTVNGSANGVIKVAADACALFKVKQKVIINAATLPVLDQIEVKKILDDNTIVIGPQSANIHTYTDLSAYTTALGAFIFANEQHRALIPYEEVVRAVYEEEPTVANRSILVDQCGDKYTTENPFPVQLSDGSINIGTVNAELEVQLSHQDNVPNPGDVADSVRIGDGEYELDINSDGSINVNVVQAPSNVEKILSVYDEAAGVVAGSETLVVDFVPASASKLYNLQRIEFTGEQIALYRVYKNGTNIATFRTHHGSGLSGRFEFTGASQEGLPIVFGDVIELKTLHQRPGTGSFEGRIQIYETGGIASTDLLLLEDLGDLLTEGSDPIALEA